MSRVGATLLCFPGRPSSTLEQDARQFLQRDNDWLSMDDLLADSQKRPLRPKTVFNYREGLRRCASTLVTHGTSASDIASLADLVRVDQVRTILKHVSERTDRKRGGHVMFLALLLFVVARDHVGIKGQVLAKLEGFFKKTRPGSIGMSDRTLERYTQFEDGKVLDRLVRLPRQLMAEADKSLKPNISAAKLARLALYLALLSETCARSGNVVGLSLDKHIVSTGTGKSRRTFVVIPANEVKNGQEIGSPMFGSVRLRLR